MVDLHFRGVEVNHTCFSFAVCLNNFSRTSKSWSVTSATATSGADIHLRELFNFLYQPSIDNIPVPVATIPTTRTWICAEDVHIHFHICRFSTACTSSLRASGWWSVPLTSRLMILLLNAYQTFIEFYWPPPSSKQDLLLDQLHLQKWCDHQGANKATFSLRWRQLRRVLLATCTCRTHTAGATPEFASDEWVSQPCSKCSVSQLLPPAYLALTRRSCRETRGAL